MSGPLEGKVGHSSGIGGVRVHKRLEAGLADGVLDPLARFCQAMRAGRDGAPPMPWVSRVDTCSVIASRKVTP